MIFDVIGKDKYFRNHSLRFRVIVLFSLISLSLTAQYQSSAFNLNSRRTNSIIVNKYIDKSGQLKPFHKPDPISGLSLNASIALHSDSSYIRILLVDTNNMEYLVYETYPLLADSTIFSISNTGEETILLNKIVPYELRFEVVDASFLLKEILTTKPHLAASKFAANQFKRQLVVKTNKINLHIQQKGEKWLAGETSISRLSYEEKKQLFGGKVPNLQGFEYYTGGIFVMPGALKSLTTLQSTNTLSASAKNQLFSSEFSWRKHHGQDWVTPVKYQGGCGSCWAFATTGVTELLVNLYYNQHIDVDLSEQQLISCANAGNCIGGSTGKALGFIQSQGIVNESCLPYKGDNSACESSCEIQSERIRIGKYLYTEANIADSLKKSIIRGPVSLNIHAWNHAVNLVGFRKIKAGDQTYIKSGTQEEWLSISEGDPLIGQTAWLIKNSWGADWGDNGYAYLITDYNGNEAYEVTGPVNSMLYNDTNIICVDNDVDGYYTWGIGPKPALCPACPDQPDGDDSNPCAGPMNAYGMMQYVTPQPDAEDVSVKPGETVPELVAEGNNIRWYDNVEPTHLVDTGNYFATGLSDPGRYYFFVTQTIDDCESQPMPVGLTIYMDVKPPVVNDVSGCAEVPFQIEASGENIKWYKYYSTFVDSRDGQSYDFVNIGDRLWMAENLNYFTPTGSSYYNNDSFSYSEKYGRLYDYNAAIKGCPSGWRLPNRLDWDKLVAYCKNDFSGYMGGRLKEVDTLNWNSPNTSATDDFGFCARPGGYGTGINNISYNKINEESDFWGYYDKYYSIRAALFYDKSWLQFSYFYENDDLHLSVRCVADTFGYITTGSQYIDTISKPGTYTLNVTQTVIGFESPPDTVTITIVSKPKPPICHYTVMLYGQPIPELKAEGENIRWYSDIELTHLIGTGNTYTPDDTLPGIHAYYATQTIECESDPAKATLLIDINPPLVNDAAGCEGQIVTINAVGENIKWYYDAYNPLSFFNPIKDARDGQIYNAVKLGHQLWLAENLNYYTPGGSQYYDNDSLAYSRLYGRLYNWETAKTVCPVDWQLPDLSDWESLFAFCGGNNVAGGKLKEAGYSHWMSPNSGASDYYGFTALPGGCFNDTSCHSLGERAYFWASDLYTSGTYKYLDFALMRYNSDVASRYSPRVEDLTSVMGSVRCIYKPDDKMMYGNQYTHTFTLPGKYRLLVTQTICGYESRWDTVTLTITSDTLPPPPKVCDVQVVSDQPVPDLTAEGDEIKWYLDPELTTLAGTGNSFKSGQSQPGVDIYYATQTSGCESNPAAVTLTIYPAAPPTENQIICEGEDVPALMASGINIKWFSDSALANLVHAGDTFTTGETRPGIYTYFVTQTVSDCESKGAAVKLIIHKMPVLFLGSDTSICQDEHLILKADNRFIEYQWYDGSASSSIELLGEQLGLGDHEVWLIISDSNSCTTSDTVIITVVKGTMINMNNGSGFIQFKPNPVSGYLYITFLRQQRYNMQICILNEDGRVLMTEKWSCIPETGTVSLDLSSLPAGTYIVRIIDDEASTHTKIVKTDW